MSKKGLDILFSEFPILRDGEFELRQLDNADASSIYALFSDPKVLEHYDINPLESEEQASEMIDRWSNAYFDRKGLRWGITIDQQEDIIGTCGLYIQSEWRATLGYDLVRSFWRQGIMTTALGQVIRYAFEIVEMNRLEALVIPGNVASERLLEKLGFTHEGLLREYMYFKDMHQNLNCYSLLMSEYVS